MKNLKTFFALTIMVMFVMSSCSKEAGLTEAQFKDNSVTFMNEDGTLDMESLMNTPTTHHEVDKNDVELAENDVELAENDINLRDCCELGTPYNLSGGTNRFRTSIYKELNTQVRYIVTRTDINYDNYTINTVDILDETFSFAFWPCQTFHHIIDFDSYGNIETGKQYRLLVVMWDPTDINGCCEHISMNFIGE